MLATKAVNIEKGRVLDVSKQGGDLRIGRGENLEMRIVARVNLISKITEVRECNKSENPS